MSNMFMILFFILFFAIHQHNVYHCTTVLIHGISWLNVSDIQYLLADQCERISS